MAAGLQIRDLEMGPARGLALLTCLWPANSRHVLGSELEDKSRVGIVCVPDRRTHVPLVAVNSPTGCRLTLGASARYVRFRVLRTSNRPSCADERRLSGS